LGRCEDDAALSGGGRGLSFTPGAAGHDDYVSDPAHPVPVMPRPLSMADRKQWTTWLVHDQRFVEDRPDVLTYKSAPLDKPLHIKGAPKVDLYAATTGTDADWVVKLIDVAPDTTPEAASQGPSPLIRVPNYRWASKFSVGAMSTAFPRPRRGNRARWRMSALNCRISTMCCCPDIA
jgi:predicted acyl esterase